MDRPTMVLLLETSHAPDPVTIRRPFEEGLARWSIYGALASAVVVIVLGSAAYQILRQLSERRAQRRGK